MVVDVSDSVSARKAKGPQRVMEEIIEGWRKYRRRFEKILAQQEGVPLSSVELRSPLARPGKCIAAFSNYIDRPGRTADNFPHEYFYKSPDLVGPGEAVELRDIPAAVVYQPEAEFAYVIGKTAKNVAESKALDYVFGYVPFFDISTRGLVRRTHFIGKGQDTHGCCGPWIITKDEIPDPIAWLSKFARLSPGDIVATGTFHEGLKPVNSGDTIEIEFANMGRAKFRVTGNSPRKDVDWLPGRDQPKPPEGGGIHKV